MDTKVTMKDKIAKTLLESEKPMHIKDIAENFSGIPESTIRGRLNDNVGKLFDRVGKGLYILKGDKGTIGLINGDARKLDDKFDDNSVDLLISDHAWLDEKSHKGGSRNFATTYECFKYEIDDFEQKFKVLKQGGFLVEFLPEKNANNKKYLREIEDLADKVGFSYFAEVNITGGNSNIGRKKKFISTAYFFTKGESRKLKIWDEKLSKMIKDGELKYMKKEFMVDFKKVYSEVLNIPDNKGKKLKELTCVGFNDWDSNIDQLRLNFIKHLKEPKLPQFKKIDKCLKELETKKIDQERLNELLEPINTFYNAFDEYVDFLNGEDSYKMGTKTILPEFFIGENLSKNTKRHESQKPLNTLEDIILQTSNTGEVIVELFAGSFIGAEAIINIGNEGKGWRNYIGIELDEEMVEKAREILQHKYKDLILFTSDDFYNSCNNHEQQLIQSNGGLKQYKKLEVVKNRINEDLINTLKIDFFNFNLDNDESLNAINFKSDKNKILSIGFSENKNMKEENRILTVIANKEKNLFEIVNQNGKVINKSVVGGNLDESLIKLYNTFL